MTNFSYFSKCVVTAPNLMNPSLYGEILCLFVKKICYIYICAACIPVGCVWCKWFFHLVEIKSLKQYSMWWLLVFECSIVKLFLA